MKNVKTTKTAVKKALPGKDKKFNPANLENIDFPLRRIIIKNDEREMNMKKLNCWEIKKCGREAGGNKVSELGVCSAATEGSSEGLNGGKAGGRICWAVTGTLCGGKVQGTSAQKQYTCMSCEVYFRVKEEEGPGCFLILKPGQAFKKHE
jgi:hypothetical protein